MSFKKEFSKDIRIMKKLQAFIRSKAHVEKKPEYAWKST